MPLWCDKQRPRTLGGLSYHPELTERLHKIAQSADLPHLLFYGPPGAGKKTRISCLLREMFGPGVEKLKVERKSFKATTAKTVEITALGSNYHLEMNPSDVGIYDRVVVQEIIKEIAASQSVVMTTEETRPFKVIVLMEADHLSKQAQHGLRRTMEKFAATCRIILCCESLSKVIEPIRSRCLAIRVPAPTADEVATTIGNVLRIEGVQASPIFISNVAQHSNRNMRRALLMAEASKVQVGPNAALGDDAPIQLPDWERYIAVIAHEITVTQSPQVLLETRAKLYELLANCIPAEIIIKSLVSELSRKLDDELKFEVVRWAASYQARLATQGQKAIYHLEAFVARFLTLYKAYLINMFT